MGNDSFRDVDALLGRVAADHQVPGLAAATTVDGEVAHVATYGWRDLARKLPMTPDSPSRWFSISKAITVLALARLVEEGEIGWDDPVCARVPGLRFADPVATERATVRDCVLHRTGLPAGDWTWWQGPSDPAALVARVAHLPCSAGFRSGFFYQNLHFTILGEVIRSAGTDWHQAVRDLLGPIGIRPITRLADFVAADRVLGYGPNGFTPPNPAADFDFEAIAPASAVCGSILELARLSAAVADGGKGLLPPERWREVTRPVWGQPAPIWPEMRQPSLAMAGSSLAYRGELALRWAGGWQGYTAHLLALPERRISACALVNRTASPTSDLLAFSMLDRAADWDPAPWEWRFLEDKRRMRKAAESRRAKRLEAARSAAWPCGVDGLVGWFEHPAYGPFEVSADGGEPRLRFRDTDLALFPQSDGSVLADSMDTVDVVWTLRPEIGDGRVTAWLLGPDDPSAPCRFGRMP